jgi:hypothetical protein
VAQLVTSPRIQAIDADGNPIVGALLYIYDAGTVTPRTTYSDSGLTTPNSQPMVANNALGIFGPIFVSTSGNNLKFEFQTPAGIVIPELGQDNVPLVLFTSADLGPILNPRTADEITAGVTPVNYQYLPGDVRRYGAVGDGIVDDTDAFLLALSVGSSVYAPPVGEYVISETLHVRTHNQHLHSDGAVLIWRGTSGNWIEIDEGLTNAWVRGFELRQGTGVSCELDWFIVVGSQCFHCGVENIYTQFTRGVINNGFILLSSAGDSYSVHTTLRNITMSGAGQASGSVAQWGLRIDGCIEGRFHNVQMYDCDRTLQIGPPQVSLARAVANLDFHGCEFQILSNTDGSDGDADSRSVVITFGQEINFLGGRLGRGASTVGSTDWGRCVDFTPLNDAAFGEIRNVNFFGVDFYGLQKGQHAIYVGDPGSAPEVVGINVFGGQMDGFFSDPVFIHADASPVMHLDPTVSVARSQSAAVNNYPANVLRVTALIDGDTLRLPISGKAYEITLAGADTITDIVGHAIGRTYQLQFGNSNCSIDFAQSAISGNAGVVRTMTTGERADVRSSGTTAYLNLYTESTVATALFKDTAANLGSIAAAINTTGKYEGKLCLDTTNHKLYVARAGTAADLWDLADGSASITPA